MKKLLLILLCLPMIGLGQTIALDDIIKVDNQSDFMRLVLEKGYVKSSKSTLFVKLYKYNMRQENFQEFTNSCATWNGKNPNIVPCFHFAFVLHNNESLNNYERIIKKIKTTCDFSYVRSDGATLTYSCSGKEIGIAKDADWGYVSVNNYPND